jgi:hypothetical protein
MSPQLTKLHQLTDELHEVNKQLSEAARPLKRSLDDKEKDAVRAQLLEGLARWDSVTAQIRRAFDELDARPADSRAGLTDVHQDAERARGRG